MVSNITNYFPKQGNKDYTVPPFRIDEQHNTKLEKLLKHFNTNNTDFFTGMIDYLYDIEIESAQTKNAGTQPPASTKSKPINKQK